MTGTVWPSDSASVPHPSERLHLTSVSEMGLVSALETGNRKKKKEKRAFWSKHAPFQVWTKVDYAPCLMFPLPLPLLTLAVTNFASCKVRVNGRRTALATSCNLLLGRNLALGPTIKHQSIKVIGTIRASEIWTCDEIYIFLFSFTSSVPFASSAPCGIAARQRK